MAKNISFFNQNLIYPALKHSEVVKERIGNENENDVLQLSGPLPSEVVTQSEVWHHIQSLVRLLLNFFLWVTGVNIVRFFSPEFDQWISSFLPQFECDLYEDIILSSAHRHLLLGAKTSVLFAYLHQFLQKDDEVSPEILSQVAQAANWARKLEWAEESWFQSHSSKRMDALSEEIATQIETLADGNSLLIPGALIEKSTLGIGMQRRYLLYRLVRQGETYRLEISSRDPEVINEGTLKKGVQTKTCSTIAFQNLSAEEMVNAQFWRALLSLGQHTSPDDMLDPNFWDVNIARLGRYAAGPLIPPTVELNTFNLTKLLEPFKERQDLSVRDRNSSYHAPRTLCRVQNLWNVIHDDPIISKTTAARRKLRLSIETLFRYFEATRRELKTSPLHRSYLQEGFRAIGQKVSFLNKQGHISDVEATAISEEMRIIEETVQRASRPESGGNRLVSNRSHLNLTDNYARNMASDQTIADEEIPRLSIQPPPLQDDLNMRPADRFIDANIPPIEIGGLIHQNPFENLTPQNCLQSLQNVIARTVELERDPYAVQHLIVEAVQNLPFRPKMENQANAVNAAAPFDFWEQLPEERRLDVVRLLTDLTKRLATAAETTKTTLPDRAVAVIKLAHISEYIAFLDRAHSGMAPQYYVHEFVLARQIFEPLSAIYRNDNDNLLTRSIRERSSTLEQQEYDILKSLSEIRRDLVNDEIRRHQATDPHFGLIAMDVFEAVKKKTLPNSPMIDFLKEIRDAMRKVCPHEKHNFFGDYDMVEYLPAKALSDWGLAIDNLGHRATAIGFYLHRNTCVASHHPIISNATEEAVIDDPQRIIDTTASLFEGTARSNLTTQELQETLLALHPQLAMYNILAIIQHAPELMNKSDVRAMFEIFFTNYRRVSKTTEKDASLSRFLPRFLHRQVDLYWSRKQFSAALYLVHLAQTLQFHATQEHLRNDAGYVNALDFSLFLMEKFEASLEENSPVAALRQTLAQQNLWVLLHKETLNKQECAHFLFLGFCFEHFGPYPENDDPVITDEVRKGYQRVLPQIAQQVPDLIPSVLDRICAMEHIALPGESWSGEFPLYYAGDVQIDLLAGLANDNRIFTTLPTRILRSPVFKKLFPNTPPHRAKAKAIEFEGGEAYAFTDDAGTQHRIEIVDEVMFFYRRDDDGTWLQFLPSSSFDANLANQIPSFIKQQKLYAVVNNPSEIFAYNNADQKQLKLFLRSPSWYQFSEKSLKIVQVDDLRPNRPDRQGMQMSALSARDPLFLHPLLSLEQEKEIIVWSKNGVIQEVELPRHGLTFQIVNEQLVCTSKPLEGFTVQQHPEEYRVNGLPLVMVLTPPNGSTKKTQLIVPKFGGGYVDNAPSICVHFIKQAPAPLRYIMHYFMDYIRRQGNLHNIPIPRFITGEEFQHKYTWEFDINNDRLNYWLFDVEPIMDVWTPADKASSGEAFFDLLRYSLFSTQANPRPAIEQSRHIIDQIRALPQQQINQEALFACAQAIAAAAVQPTKLVSPPYAETIGVALQALLVLQDKASPKYKQDIDEGIAGLVLAYCSTGKHNDIESLLSPEQLIQVWQTINASEKMLPPDLTLALLGERDPKARIMPQEASRFADQRTFHFQKNNINSVITSVTAALKTTDLDPELHSLSFSKSGGRLVRGFPCLYEVLRGPSDSLDFKNIYYTLKSMPLERGRAHVTQFLEWLFEQKQHGAQLDLPDFPDYSAFRLKADSSLSGYQRMEQENEIRAQKNACERELEKFFAQLPVPKEEPAMIIDAPPPISPNALHFAALQQRSPEFLEVTTHLQEINSEQLDQALPSYNAAQRMIDLIPEDGTELISKEQADQLFSKNSPDPLPELDLTRVKQHSEPSVAAHGAKIEKELSSYQKALQNEGVRQFADLEQIKLTVNNMVAHRYRAAQQALSTVNAQLDHSKNQFTSAERMGGYEFTVTLTDLSVAFLQNDFNQIMMRLRGVNEGMLRTAVANYLKAETLYKHALYAQKEVGKIFKENLRDSSAAAEKVYGILTRQRGYNCETHPELLVVENALGFLMNQKQLLMVQKVLTDPQTVEQAVTGSGKTSVIMTLLGLLKANGTNLVTLKFLDPLFPENARTLQKMLGAIMRKKVMHLVFTARTPTVIKLKDGSRLSYFRKLYEDLLLAIQNRGCLLTNRRSLPLLQAKFIAILDRAEIKKANGEEVDAIELDHLHFLGKILLLMSERQECIDDEHDKANYPRDEFHLSLGESTQVPDFSREVVKEVTELLLQIPDLHLKENTQAELHPDIRVKIIDQAATIMADRYQNKTGYSSELLKAYFIGKSEDLLKALNENNADDDLCDRLALLKDLFITYLPTSLAYAANKRYILSAIDGVSVIPCEYSDVPREGSQFDNLIERLQYTVQYYYQKGIGKDYLKTWIENVCKEGLKQMEEDSLASIDQTMAHARFQRVFPNRALPLVLTADELNILHAEVANDPTKISYFLDLIISDMRVDRRTVSIDPQNIVSMSKASAGISATRGCEKGLHNQFHIPEVQEHANAQMLVKLLQRTNGKGLLFYTASNPSAILTDLLQQEHQAAVVIDGAGALLGITPKQAAEKILQERTQLKCVYYFDVDGGLKFVGNQTENLSERGQHFSHAQSRGANVDTLSPSLHAILLTTPKKSIEEIEQNAGRLRDLDQPLRIAVPRESGIRTIHDLISEAAINEELESGNNVYRSEMQKLRDYVRSQMLQQLYYYAVDQQVDHAVETYRLYKPAGILVTEKAADFNIPGTYAQLNGAVQQKNMPPAEILEQKLNRMLTLCNDIALPLGSLETYHPNRLANEMPSLEWNNTHSGVGQEAEVEVENEVEVEQELEVEVEEQHEIGDYAEWCGHYEDRFTIHQFPLSYLDPNLRFTENFCPLNRGGGAMRELHDKRQNRLRFIAVGQELSCTNGQKQIKLYEPKLWYNRKINALQQSMNQHDIEQIDDIEQIMENPALPLTAVACDQEDVRAYLRQVSAPVIYDTKLRRFIGEENQVDEEQLPKFTSMMAQLRFLDGQCFEKNYAPKEWLALKEWLYDNRNNLTEIESYLTDRVLRRRVKGDLENNDLEHYPFSDLKKLLDECRKQF